MGRSRKELRLNPQLKHLLNDHADIRARHETQFCLQAPFDLNWGDGITYAFAAAQKSKERGKDKMC
jgi:hypothetical protein